MLWDTFRNNNGESQQLLIELVKKKHTCVSGYIRICPFIQFVLSV